MIAVDYISYVRQLLDTRKITSYHLDILRINIPANTQRIYTSGQRAYFYLLTENLPEGCLIASENTALLVNQDWSSKSLSKIQEFKGQMLIELPEAGVIREIEFIRAIPRL
jgi:hypothetical protein